MTAEEQAIFVSVEVASECGFGYRNYQRLVNAIADRVHAEFGLTGDHDFDLADAALREADDGPEGAAYFERYEKLLRSKYAAVELTKREAK